MEKMSKEEYVKFNRDILRDKYKNPYIKLTLSEDELWIIRDALSRVLQEESERDEALPNFNMFKGQPTKECIVIEEILDRIEFASDQHDYEETITDDLIDYSLEMGWREKQKIAAKGANNGTN